MTWWTLELVAPLAFANGANNNRRDVERFHGQGAAWPWAAMLPCAILATSWGALIASSLADRLVRASSSPPFNKPTSLGPRNRLVTDRNAADRGYDHRPRGALTASESEAVTEEAREH